MEKLCIGYGLKYRREGMKFYPHMYNNRMGRDVTTAWKRQSFTVIPSSVYLYYLRLQYNEANILMRTALRKPMLEFPQIRV